MILNKTPGCSNDPRTRTRANQATQPKVVWVRFFIFGFGMGWVRIFFEFALVGFLKNRNLVQFLSREISRVHSCFFSPSQTRLLLNSLLTSPPSLSILNHTFLISISLSSLLVSFKVSPSQPLHLCVAFISLSSPLIFLNLSSPLFFNYLSFSVFTILILISFFFPSTPTQLFFWTQPEI